MPRAFSVRTKLLFGFLFIALLIVVSSVLIIRNTYFSAIIFDDIVDNDTVRLRALYEMQNIINDVEDYVLRSRIAVMRKELDVSGSLVGLVDQLEYWQRIYKEQGEGRTVAIDTFLSEFSESSDVLIADVIEVVALMNMNANDEAVGENEQIVLLRIDDLTEKISYQINWEVALIEEKNRQSDMLVQRSARLSIITAGIVVIVAVVVGGLVSRLIVSPLRTMQQFTVNIANGNFDKRIPVLAHDEIGDLAQSFNVMVDHLQQSRQEIENSSRVLKVKIDELERMNKIMVDRELKMVELKDRIKELEGSVT